MHASKGAAPDATPCALWHDQQRRRAGKTPWMTSTPLNAGSTPGLLAALSLVILTLAVLRTMRRMPDLGRQARTWLFIGVTFAAVSWWLFARR